MADLQLDIGANLDGLRKAMGEAGRMIDDIDKKSRGQSVKKEKSSEQKIIDFSKKDFTSTQGIAQMVGGALGGAVASIALAVADLIKSAYDIVKRYADEARELVNLSRSMNLTTQEIQKLKGASIASGVSLNTLARANAEFNKRAGEASLKGGEFLAVIQRLGVNLNDIKNKTVKFDDAIRLLQKAHKAGTDEATMNYLANTLLGSSYQELLPLINRSEDALKKYGNKIQTNSSEELKRLEQFANDWDIFWTNLEVSFKKFVVFALDLLDVTNQPQEVKESYMGQAYMNSGGFGGKIDIEKVKQEAKKKEEEYNIEKGKAINLPAMQAALGANTLQQMGGGDIFGAVGWSPMQKMADDTAAIKTAAQQTAQNTGRVSENTPTNYSPAPNMNDK